MRDGFGFTAVALLLFRNENQLTDAFDWRLEIRDCDPLISQSLNLLISQSLNLLISQSLNLNNDSY